MQYSFPALVADLLAEEQRNTEVSNAVLFGERTRKLAERFCLNPLAFNQILYEYETAVRVGGLAHTLSVEAWQPLIDIVRALCVGQKGIPRGAVFSGWPRAYVLSLHDQLERCIDAVQLHCPSAMERCSTFRQDLEMYIGNMLQFDCEAARELSSVMSQNRDTKLYHVLTDFAPGLA